MKLLNTSGCNLNIYIYSLTPKPDAYNNGSQKYFGSVHAQVESFRNGVSIKEVPTQEPCNKQALSIGMK
jgi:hypothetical protein